MSFRTKITLLVGIVTGGIVISAVWLLWDMTYRFNLEALDQDAYQIVQSNIGKAGGVSYWERLDDSLAQFSQDAEGDTRFRLWVEPHGRRAYISSDWPMNINPRSQFRAFSPTEEIAGDSGTAATGQIDIISLPSLNEHSDGIHWRVGIYFSSYGNVAIAFNVDAFDARINRLKWRFFLVAPLAIILSLVGAWFVSGRSLRPLEKLTSTVESVTTQELDQRVEEGGLEKEFHRLVAVFNSMMSRLEKSFNQASRFSADASHELKTPLTRLQMEVERAMKESTPASGEQKVYSSLLDEISHLSNVVKNLTLLSSSDAGKLSLTLETVDLRPVLENVVEDWRALDEGRVFELKAPNSITVQCDRTLIEQAIQNLVSNAVKHGQADSEIKIQLDISRELAEISITNQGVPISIENQERLFERFFRADSSRNASMSGVGLGLSLTREIARAHNGEVSLVRSDSESTVFRMTLPASVK